MQDKKSVVTQIRLPKTMHTEIKLISDSTGDSLNGTMLHLMHWGLKLYGLDRKELLTLPALKE